jgi:long-chain fatty acid transport protein
VWSSRADAGGFYVPEVGPRAAAMGGAMAAQDADASAVFHNPAGLAGQTGTQIQFSGTVFLPNLSFFRRPVVDPNSPTGEEIRFDRVENTNSVGAAPYLGAVSDFGISNFAAGIAIYAPFGAAISYPTDGSQRHVVTSVDLKVIHVSPAVAYRLSDRFRVGVSLSYIFSELSLEQRNAIQYVNGDPEVFPDPDPAVEGENFLDVKDPVSVSATLGAMYTDPRGRFRIGASVLTPVTLHLEGDADIRNSAITPLMDGDGNVVQEGGQRTDSISAEMPMPLIVRIGANIQPHPRVMVAVDVNWQRWSTFDELVIDFENEHELLPTPGVYLYDVTIANEWSDTFSFRLGAEVQPLADRPLRVRAGALYDQSPIDDQHFDLLAPDSDKLGIGGGLSYTLVLGASTPLELDLSYQHLFFAERDVTDSEKTILNKPAPSFYSGITRTGFDVIVLSTGVRF